MPGPAITKGSDHFFNVLYEGNGGGQRVGNFVPFTDNGTIAKSAIFNSADNANLSRTPSGAGNRKTFTISFWIKRAKLATTNGQQILTSHTDSNNRFQMFFDASVGGGAVGNKLTCFDKASGSTTLLFETNRTFEDTSKWYHIVLAFDTTQSTASDRMKLYVDGDQITSFDTINYPAQDYQLRWNINAAHYIGRYGASTSYPLDAYLAEFNNVDGTALTPSTFGLTDTSTGRWIPKSLTGITYGTNGFRLQFANSAGQTIGDDTGGGTNDFTVNNMAATDITTDSPTQNHTILSPNFTAGTVTLSEGNLTLLGSGSSVYGSSRSTFEIDIDDTTGYYFEARNTGSATDNINIGFQNVDTSLSATAYGGSNFYGLVSRGSGGSNQYWRILGGSTDVTTSVGHSSNDWIGVAIKQGKVWFAINNTYVFSGNPVTKATPFLDISAFAKKFFITIECFQNNKLECNFGQKSFNYSAPSGYVSIQQDNLPTTEKGMSDFVWIKNRDATDDHQLYDNSRGPQKMLEANQSTAEETDTDGLQKFLKGGCQIEDDVRINTSGESYVSWNWVANGGTTTANTDGSGATLASTIQANQTAGFSVVTYTGNASAGAKVAHGLSQAPDWFIIKSRSVATNWYVYHKDLGASSGLYLNTNAAASSGSANAWNQTNPTSSVITLNGTGYGSNNNSATYLMYCWHEVPGYSKFGIYTGGGGTDGTFTYTGFRPAWLLVKRHNSSGNWYLIDTARGKFNDSDGSGKTLMPNHTNAEAVQTRIDLLSNGFKQRISNDGSNLNSAPYVYFAFAENPFVGDGTNPVTAR